MSDLNRLNRAEHVLTTTANGYTAIRITYTEPDINDRTVAEADSNEKVWWRDQKREIGVWSLVVVLLCITAILVSAEWAAFLAFAPAFHDSLRSLFSR